MCDENQGTICNLSIQIPALIFTQLQILLTFFPNDLDIPSDLIKFKYFEIFQL